jgi:hypothetical protein
MAVPEPTTDMPAAEMTATDPPTEVATTHAAAAEVTSTTAEVATPTAVTSTTSAAATCKRIGGDASASHSYRGNDDRNSVQRKCLHDCFLSD